MPSGQPYDLLLTGAEVLDPGQQLHGRLDIAVANGRISAVAKRIDPAQARQVIDLTGKLVTPGLIDIHGHCYPGGCHRRQHSPRRQCHWA